LFCPVIFIEGKSGFAAYGRSWKLVKGKWWSTFGLLVVMSIIVSIIGVAFQLPLLLISIFKEILQWDNGRSFELIIMLASIIGMLGETLLFSILHISLGFQYFNLVERQASIGPMREIDSLGRQNEFDSHDGDYYAAGFAIPLPCTCPGPCTGKPTYRGGSGQRRSCRHRRGGRKVRANRRQFPA